SAQGSPAISTLSLHDALPIFRIVRLGTPRERGEGLRIGTVRRPPRGVRKDQYAVRNFFDVWLPELAPSQTLVRWIMAAPLTPKRSEEHTSELQSRSDLVCRLL